MRGYKDSDPKMVAWRDSLFTWETKPTLDKRWINSLSPESCGSNFKAIIFKRIIQSNSRGSLCESALRLMAQNLTNEKSTLVKIMTRCREATSHYPGPVDPDLCSYMASLDDIPILAAIKCSVSITFLWLRPGINFISWKSFWKKYIIVNIRLNRLLLESIKLWKATFFQCDCNDKIGWDDGGIGRLHHHWLLFE